MTQALNVILADLAYIRSEFVRNEEIGEKRFGFFVTLVTAVGAGLVAVAADENAASFRHTAIALGIAGLLAFGLLTFVRLKRRNNIADHLKRMANEVHERIVTLSGEAELEEHHLEWPKKEGLERWIRAGYAEVVGIIDGVLLGALLISLGVPAEVGVLGGLPAALGLWFLAVNRRHDPNTDRQFRTWLGAASRLWRRVAEPRQLQQPGQYFRAGVGAVIRNADSLILALERRDIPGAWQLPQGGLNADEEPEETVWREIAEETGLARESLTVVARFPELLAYELPPSARSAKTGRGQVQYWFLLDLAPAAIISLPADGEFRDCKWMRLVDLAAMTVPFRRPVYERLAAWAGDGRQRRI